MEAIYLLWRLMEWYWRNHEDIPMVFIDLEKGIWLDANRGVWKALETKGVYIAYIWAIKDTYEVTTSSRTQGGVKLYECTKGQLWVLIFSPCY